jgi:hypothetical protein
MATQSAVPALDDSEIQVSTPATAPGRAPAPADVTSADRKQFESQLKATEAALKAQPKVKIRVPEDTRVQINGYGMYIAAKQWVEVPQQVAELLEEAGRL